MWRDFSDAVSRRLWALDCNALCADVRHRTGLEDYGAPAVEPALSTLVNSLEREAGLHPTGRFLMQNHLRQILETRLRLTEAWKKKSETLAASPIVRPLFITGMPRSGSTFLHELLAEDPDNRAPRVWEVMFPIQAPASTRGPDPRIRKAAACLWGFRCLAPRADSVHPMRASTPQECVAILNYTLMSEAFVSTCRVPAYKTYLRSADHRQAYGWQRHFLQDLQLRCPDKRWVLKSPDHVYNLEALFSVYPDAVIILTHRNPLKIIRSISQLSEVLHGVFIRPASRDQIVRWETEALVDCMDYIVRFRDAHPELADRFVDLNYRELVSDPLAAVRRIYQRFEIPLTEVAAERMRHLAASRSRYQRRRTKPTPADLELDVRAQERRFHTYCFRFGIPL